MRQLFVSLLVATLSACAYGQGVQEYFIYREAGPVPYNANGVPQMNVITSNDTAPDTNASLVYLGKVHYNNSIFEMGWDTLSVAPSRPLFLGNDTALQAWYGAGYAEGYATMQSIADVVTAQGYNYSADGQQWINDHLAFVRTNALSQTDAFWTQVRKQLVQMEGIADGYNARLAKTGGNANAVPLTFDIVFQINILNEYSDIAPAAALIYGDGKVPAKVDLGTFRRPKKTGPATVPMSEQHCSGLIKVTANDLLMSHVTWSGYNIFVGRQYKTYMMETTVSMSSNALLINSGGDWYQTNNKLSIIETTNEFTNNDLYKLIKPQCVSEFMRVMVANFLATTSQQWTEVFSIHQSGTYCNQWMVLDYKLYTKGMSASQLPDGLFWIAEEIPGQVATGDLTGFIRENGYWGSYNIPYFKNIFDLSGFGVNQQAYGDFFSWFMTPRAQIFRRDHHKVTDLVSMQRMMHYNDWQNDPLSAIQNCVGCVPTNSPMLGVSSRGDLVPKNASFGNMNANYAQDFAFNWFGATDSKISSYDMINNGFSASIVNGPTHDTQPVFSWSVDPTNPLAVLPGMIQTFDFPWQPVGTAYLDVLPAPVPQSTYRNITVDVFRKPGPVTFDADGVPVVKMVAGLRGTIAPTPDLIPLATAVYNESGLATGYDQLSVSAVPSLFETTDNAFLAWYAAGFAEGYASTEAIAIVNVWRNYTYTAATMEWVEVHLTYMRLNALISHTPYWKQVRKQLLQMEGIADGMNLWYQHVDATFKPMTFLDVFMINFRDDNDDVIAVATAPAEVREELRRNRPSYRGDHCSAMVKVTEDDVLMSQATWAGYAIMIHKQIKTYIMSTTVTFSCNAGMIFSGDDWYQTSNKLGVQETTNEFKNASLYNLIKPECVSEFMRVMIANYLATDAKEWVDFYSREPSGTYCNQWMVFDYKLYGPSVNQSNLPDNSFWIAEEIPGLIKSADMTPFLRDNGYWASYNVPYFAEIALISGFTEYYNLYGDFYSWSNTPRANIFRRDQSKVTDVESLRKLMRYNDWQNDPLSAIPNCTGCVPANSPICAIASRADLVPANANFGDLGDAYKNKLTFGMWGAPDAKISSYKMINDGFASSNSLSPSNEHVPMLNFNAWPNYPTALSGLVQFYNFSAVDMKPSQPIPDPAATLGERYYVYRTSGDGVPAPITSIPNITFVVTAEHSEADADSLIATVQYNKTSAAMGWDQITVTANQQLFADKHPLQAWYGAGIAEGFATMQAMKDVMATQNYTRAAATQAFLDQQLSFLRTHASSHVTLKQAYWRQVRKQLLQMEGLAAGFNLRAELVGDTARVTMMDVFAVNLYNEMSDIIGATTPASERNPNKSRAADMHCSAIVKVAEDDVYFGQTMWAGYNVLVGRQYKTYEMETTVSMSANAVYIASGDDWYITSNKLTAMETTNNFFNMSLYDLIAPETTPEFMRVMIANYVANTAEEWVELFAQNHSGTYCNQYMVFDLKLYTKGQSAASLADGTFWVVEELPGMVSAGDQTAILRNTTYWGSYNTPFFEDIYTASGFALKRDQYGSLFDYKLTPRAQMWARVQGSINTTQTVFEAIRYNDWQNDPLSDIPDCPTCSPRRSPMLGLAGRADLVPLDNNYASLMDSFLHPYYKNDPFGAIDAKVSSSTLFNEQFASYIELGPTHESLPPFVWAHMHGSTDFIGILDGMIQVWDFGPSVVTPLSTVPAEKKDKDNTGKLIIGIIVTSIVSVIMIGALAYCFLSKVERRGDQPELEPLVQ